MPAQRDHAIDFLRAAYILYIVGYWHLFGYTPALFAYANDYTEAVKDVALATLVFVSGFLLASRDVALTPRDLYRFYQRRVARIYPLYLLALVLFALTQLATREQAIEAALLVSMFSPPAIYTLWFITMIMFFYVATPLFLQMAARPMWFVVGSALVLAALAVAHRSHGIDVRIVQYFPAFVWGVWLQRRRDMLERMRRWRWGLLGALVPAFAVGVVSDLATLTGALLRIPLVLCGATVSFVFAERYAGTWRSPAVYWISYASFCIYLLHRLVFLAALKLHAPVADAHRALYLLLIGLPVTVVLSVLVQKGYDTLLRQASAPAPPRRG